MTPTETENELQPLALLVEDDEKSLRLRQELLSEHGIITVAVRSVEEAMREFLASPGVDLVITDIKLNPTIPGDKAGVGLADQLRHISKDLPIVGYSAAFAEGDLSTLERQSFTSYYPRGRAGAREFAKYVQEWRQDAVTFHEKRISSAQERLSDLRKKYALSEPDYSVLRFLVPHKLIQADGDPESVENVLRGAGFELRLIGRGSKRPTVDDNFRSVKSPIPVWLREENGVSVAEVYGFPELYSHGKTKDGALENLLVLMDGFYQDLSVTSDESTSNRLTAMSAFLADVFE